eukprot:7894800-Ditylum_brightwellii.AAC.1
MERGFSETNQSESQSEYHTAMIEAVAVEEPEEPATASCEVVEDLIPQSKYSALEKHVGLMLKRVGFLFLIGVVAIAAMIAVVIVVTQSKSSTKEKSTVQDQTTLTQTEIMLDISSSS